MSLLLDACGVAALAVGTVTGELTFALGIGYTATTVAGAFGLALVMCETK
eukprot:COSAG02_NODE_29496_length_568_cov_0.731343_1_plen_49_part_10